MSALLYQILLYLAYPLVRLRLRLRARHEPEYGRRISERFGTVPPDVPAGAIWFHTVSAGETIAAAPLIAELASMFDASHRTPFLVTTMTPTGSHQVTVRLAGVVTHCYAPYDFRAGVRRFYDRVQPRLLVLMETELWPNLIGEAKRRGVPVLLVNGRLSERSARGYARVGGLTRQMLSGLRAIACQYPDHVERFIALGADPGKLSALGSVKFDVSPGDAHHREVDRLTMLFGTQGRAVWIAGSTHPGEDEVVLAAHRRVLAAVPALLLLVPRHPVRAADVLQLAREAGFEALRESEMSSAARADVIVCDTMGELQALYGLSDIAFLGGSLVGVGGHNPIEAAVCEQPLVIGPHVFNFPDVVAIFKEAGVLTMVADEEELAGVIAAALLDTEATHTAGKAAAALVRENRGATGRLLELLRAEIEAALAQ
ncbi:MAG: lipid IV(A) 3-deoxy-D-manno-octulosonic acid transferase [Pseudomonadales bacterium]|nr:lipid IV(A) 3-deoxy-D-manno-octulosonic acid transferase [Pseudomonadales bacterium]MDP6469539.1 lipid IV(A) 3-deoxy-D-manno-octulosonic acid transferase [Pseudomonadales bacterium]MDP6827380.1 lipid IV(A) 3-deoxy-D-manno-octulosonic acid transferase [Pseudomonadales bacterium]MDP6971203.1 lipid IV(A) 3-deoxy-D-manno-octulosonic acid transferase [Pseudomonadales bacterium]